MGGKGTGISQEKERIYRMDCLWEMHVQHTSWEREKLIAKYQYKYGSSRRTVLDYLRILENAGKIKWEKDKIN